ncbi:MAG: ATP-binding protein [Clostridia bacterium]|nr:ATP-binding protein [Clostridia bacterium]
MSKDMASKNLRPLPIGISDYIETVTDCYYVDKTLLIRDILSKKTKVYLFTRPRRFGKTLNMSMLQTFFEDTGEDKSIYFKDKKIWQCGTRYTDKMGTSPVISISFREAGADSWRECYSEIKKVIVKQYEKWADIANNPKLTPNEAETFNAIVSKRAKISDFKDSLQLLSDLIFKCNGNKPVILIDEYDEPIQKGYLNGYYDKVIKFIRPLFSKALKDNANIEFAVLTGINRVSKESIFSGLNNLKTYSILDDNFSEYFGLTRDEVKEMFDYYGYSDSFDTACKWYDGYRFGKTDIFNPWSIINYIDDGASSEPKDYWINTSGNDIISDMLKSTTPEVLNNLIALLQGETVVALIDENLAYPDLKGDVANVYSLLLMSGYLKTQEAQFYSLPENLASEMAKRHNYCLAIPNEEVRDEFFLFIKKLLASFYAKEPDGKLFIEIWDAITARNAETLECSLSGFLSSTASYFDTAYESFYQGFMLSVCAYKWGKYHVRTQIPSGKGRYDIGLEPREKGLPGVIIEIESVTKSRPNYTGSLDILAQAGLEQIKSREYDRDMRSHGVEDIIFAGIAFNKEDVRVAIE